MDLIKRWLVADFVRTFGGGPRIEFAAQLPADRFRLAVLFGPSGCGKTTVLRCLAGLDRPQQGRIHLGDDCWVDVARGIWLPPQSRRIAYVTQDDSLFPHLTAGQNIAFALRRMPVRQRRQVVADLLAMMRLDGLEHRYPRQLSGGQRQRVALARALARGPQLLLLDEPFSSLDEPTRTALRQELRRWLARMNVPAVLVTHDRDEAMAVADHLLLMHEGRIVQQGPPADVFFRPATAEVARMVGTETVVAGRLIRVDNGLAEIHIGRTPIWAVTNERLPQNLLVAIRPEHVTIVRGTPPETSARNRLAGRIVAIQPLGSLVRIELDCGFRLVAMLTWHACRELALEPNLHVTAEIKAAAIHLIPMADTPDPTGPAPS